MNLRSIVIATALSATVPAMASECTSTFSLGTLAPTTVGVFGNDFSAPQSFNDCYTFTLSQAPSTATTTTIEWDWSTAFNIDVSSVSLSGGNLVSYVGDVFAQSWTFSGLTAGDYLLQVAGDVISTGREGYDLGIGYTGLLRTSGPVVTPVPEPAALAMLALGLGAVVWGARRKS
jgi:hypothetical protein